MKHYLILFCLLLVSCGPPTTAEVIDKFRAAGLTVENVHTVHPSEDTAVYGLYKEYIAFTFPGPQDTTIPGILFTCDTNCARLTAVIDEITIVLGPHATSPDGHVIVIMGTVFSPREDLLPYIHVVQNL